MFYDFILTFNTNVLINLSDNRLSQIYMIPDNEANRNMELILFILEYMPNYQIVGRIKSTDDTKFNIDDYIKN